MKTADDWFDIYRHFHQHPVNQLIQCLCAPVIFFSVVGLLWVLPRGPLTDLNAGVYQPYANWATAAIVLGLIYYFALSVRVGLGMLVWCALCLFGARVLELWGAAPVWVTSAVLLVFARIGQLVGYRLEGHRPALIQDLQFLMVGPAWLLHRIYRRLGISH